MKKASHISLIFPWRRSYQRRFFILLILFIIVPVAVFLYYNLTISIISVIPQQVRRAEFYLLPTASEQTAHISEKTPFPLTSSSLEIEKISDTLLQQALQPELNRNKNLKEIPELRDVTVFPKVVQLPPAQETSSEASPPAKSVFPQPRMRLITAQSAPQPISWPIFPHHSSKLDTQKYMIHINQQGFVDECQPVETASTNKIPEIVNWLLMLRYPIEKNNPSGWFYCTVEWINCPP